VMVNCQASLEERLQIRCAEIPRSFAGGPPQPSTRAYRTCRLVCCQVHGVALCRIPPSPPPSKRCEGHLSLPIWLAPCAVSYAVGCGGRHLHGWYIRPTHMAPTPCAAGCAVRRGGGHLNAAAHAAAGLPAAVSPGVCLGSGRGGGARPPGVPATGGQRCVGHMGNSCLRVRILC
jgi:hypothetical protein